MAVKIKICGLTQIKDIEYVNEFKPDYVGFVFFPPSSRYVTLEKAIQLKNKLSKDINTVGVFLDNPLEEILEVVDRRAVDIIQLHGKTAPELVRRLKELVNIPIWEAISINSQTDLIKARDSLADMILLDHGAGGSGKAFDWSVLKKLDRDFILAGGLDASNVREALKYKPYGVDVSTGVETDKIKDRKKIQEFIQIVRSKEED